MVEVDEARDSVSVSVEGERAVSAEVLRQSGYFAGQRLFDETMHYLSNLILVLNDHAQTVYINRAVLEFLGRKDCSGLLGLRPGDLFLCHNAGTCAEGCGSTPSCQYCGGVRAIQLCQQGESAIDEWNIMAGQEGDEDSLTLRIWANPMQMNDEQFIFLTAVNIAEEKRKVFLERIFLHDILNTASALQGLAGLMASGDLDEAEGAEFRERIHLLANRITDEIRGHQQLVAAENNKLKLNIETVKADALLRGLYNSYHRADVLASRNIEIAEDSTDVEIETDPTILGRVIGNMAKNAIEASAPGEMVALGCRIENGQAVFWVHNQTYMPQNIRSQLFKRSFSTKGVGRGLGTYSMQYLTR